MNNKLMAAVAVATVTSLCTSIHSLNVASKARLDSNKAFNRSVADSVSVDRLIGVVENVQTNQMKLLDYVKQVDDEVGKEIKERRALEAVVEQNAKELIRISGNLERDSDKMYTNIVMFGASVFDLRNELAVACMRVQELERGLVKPQVPTVNAAKPALVPSDATDPQYRETSNEKLKERLDIGPADLGPAPGN